MYDCKNRISLIKYRVHRTAYDEYLSLEKCPDSVVITSSGLTKTHHPNVLGRYVKDGSSNGRISYINAAGYYLHFHPDKRWVVSPKYKKYWQIWRNILFISALLH